jgi:hypothetical protein
MTYWENKPVFVKVVEYGQTSVDCGTGHALLPGMEV